MTNSGVSIRYGDVAPEAKENFYPEASEQKFDTLAQLQQYNLNFPNYANPCELYSVVLDGTATAFPSVPEQANLGLWSEQISNDDGTFTEPIVLELESVGQYSSQGLTLTFDTYNQIYPTHINIKWFRYADGTMTELSPDGGVDFYPDNAFYFCRNFVENYNKIVITFYSLNMPKNRLKLRVIDYGYGTFFYGDELRGVKLIQEIDPISTQISINTADFTLDSKSDIEYNFQQKQPLEIYFNGVLKASTFVKSSKRKSRFLWTVQSEDYISLMENVPFYGDIYNGKDAYVLIEEIFKTAKVPYKINEKLKGILLYGYIPFTNCREALMQVSFAVQNVVDTSNRENINVFELSTEIKQEIPLERIMQGQNFDYAETVTSVEVSVHSFVKKEEISDNKVMAYDASESGTGENIFVIFSEPLFGLHVVSDGEILEYGSNYAIVNANSSLFKLVGYGYEHRKTIKKKSNPVVLSSEAEKVIAIDNATLVSIHNVDNVLEKCYNWLTRTNTTNLKIIEGKHVQYGDFVKYGEKKYGTARYGEKHPNIITYDEPVNMGERINAQTEYLGLVDGIITKQSFNLNGNIIVKDVVLK